MNAQTIMMRPGVVGILWLISTFTTSAAPLTSLPVDESAAEFSAVAPCDCDACADCADDCRPPTIFWGSAEYVGWWRSQSNLPPLVSTGILGNGGTVLFGGDVGGGSESGFRGTLGIWLDRSHATGVMARYFTVGDESVDFDSGGFANVARPFIDLTPGSPVFGEENVVVVNDADLQTFGNVDVGFESRIWGLDLLYRLPIRCNATDRLDFLAGYQTSRIEEDLLIRQDITEGGVTIDGVDAFRTDNEFHGGVLGLQFQRVMCRWSGTAIAKIGLGNVKQSVSISGDETRAPPPTSSTGSLLALPTNIGNYARDEFTFVPELGVNLGYQIDHRFNVSIGYSFVYWDKVVLAGDQIDRAVNGTQVSGGTLDGVARPAFSFVGDNYWLQGITLGLSAEF